MEEADNVQLVQHLQDAETMNLKLRQQKAKLSEQVVELKKELKLLRSQSTSNSSYRSDLERLREQESAIFSFLFIFQQFFCSFFRYLADC